MFPTEQYRCLYNLIIKNDNNRLLKTLLCNDVTQMDTIYVHVRHILVQLLKYEISLKLI